MEISLAASLRSEWYRAVARIINSIVIVMIRFPYRHDHYDQDPCQPDPDPYHHQDAYCHDPNSYIYDWDRCCYDPDCMQSKEM